jgi:DNA-binding Xre family transcriptional regulator
MLFRIDRKKLYLACANMCLSTSEAIKEAGCSTMTFHRINNGKPVQSVTIGKIAKFLGVKPSDIIAE